MKRPTPMSPAEFRKWADRMGYRSREEVGKALGINPVTVWRWENGKAPVPPYVRLACLYIEGEGA